MHRSARCVLPLLSIAAISGTALADGHLAEQRFREGDALLASGNVAAACAAFERSNELEARAGTLIRLGDCREQANELASALAAYEAALARAKDPEKRRLASLKLRELTARASTLTISVGDVGGVVITRNGETVPPRDVGRPLPVNGGRYTIGATAPGHEPFTATVMVDASNAKVVTDVVMRPVPVPIVPSPRVVAAQINEERPVRSPEPIEREDRSLLRRPVFWIGVGSALVAGSVAIYVATRSGSVSCTGNCVDLR